MLDVAKMGRCETPLTSDLVHQGDDFLCKRARVHGGLTVRPRVLQHGQKVQPLAAHVDQV